MSRCKLTLCLLTLFWAASPAGAQIIHESCLNNGAPISDGLPPVVEMITVPENQTVEDIQVSVAITHTWVGDLLIDIEGPLGDVVVLHDQSGGNTDDMNLVYWDNGIPNGPPYDCGCALSWVANRITRIVGARLLARESFHRLGRPNKRLWLGSCCWWPR